MKPAFALDFRDTAVSLLHRTGTGWHEVGSVPLDEPDLPAALGYLRATALGLSPRGIATKLVIPNDQILYTSVVAPGPDAASRRKQIRKALEGRTPYPVEELVFDFWGKGPEVQVAVIAKETLAEAEAFAAEHRFNPVSFVAVPGDGTFRGEPWFGPTALAPTLLAAGEKVERDQDPVTLLTRSFAADPAPEPKGAVAVEDEPAHSVQEPDLVPEPEFVPEPEYVPEVMPEPAFIPEAEMLEVVPEAAGLHDEPVPATQAEVAALPDAAPYDDAPFDAPAFEAPRFEPGPVTATPLTARIVATPAPQPVMDPAPISAPVQEALPQDSADLRFDEILDATPEPDFVADDAHLPEPEDILSADPDLNPAPLSAASHRFSDSPPASVDEAPMALDVTDEDAAPKPVTGVLDPAIAEDVPPMPSWTPAMAFASRRSADGAEAKAPAGKPPAKPLVERPSGAKPLPAAPPRPGQPLPAAPSRDNKGLRGIGSMVTAPGLPGSKKQRKPVAPPPAAAPRQPVAPISSKPATGPAQKPVRESLGLGSRPAPQRGKPKYLGLILTAILLVFLAIVAGWSTYLASLNEDTTAVDTASADTGADVPAPEDEMLADMQDPADFAEDGTETAGTETAGTETTPEEVLAPEAVTTEAAPATTVATESAPPPRPTDEVQDEIFLATMDAPPSAPDPLAMPQPEARDALPDAQPAPPPFGTVYQFDANGLILPTAEGIVTPEGVRLVAGKPPLEPPERPAALTAAGTALTPAPADVAADAPFPSDPALAGARPKARPTGLSPPASDAAAAPEDDASLAPAADSRFASLRPQARPEAIVAAGEEARLAAASASLASAEPAAAVSPLAVAISRKPATRPQDLSRAVEAAVAAATRAPEPEPTPAPEPEPAAKPKKAAKSEATEQLADDEPETASAAPSIPTKASVAKTATFKNAINLSKVNLIGVYGTQSSRYALVRQENGRYKKVAIGDRIDGGKVAAITATELRYQKGGRMITLALPKG